MTCDESRHWQNELETQQVLKKSHVTFLHYKQLLPLTKSEKFDSDESSKKKKRYQLESLPLFL